MKYHRTLRLICWLACSAPLAAQSQATVRVAAVQCASPMGATEANRSNLVHLIRRAARDGARIVVTPECAVQGYTHPPTWTSWTSATNGGTWAVGKVAETIPGRSTEIFSALAKELGVYLCVGLIERDGDRFYNAQALLAPDGSLAAHHRKKALWTPGDSLWCSRGGRPIQVVDTPFGRLGLMICFDVHALPELLAKQSADIVLYSVAWYGPNEDEWFRTQLPRRTAEPFGFHVVAANWAAGDAADTWPGLGHSCVLRGDGRVLAMAGTVVGNEVVMADIPLRRTPAKTASSGKDAPSK